MSAKSNPFKERQARKAAAGTAAVPEQASPLPGVPAATTSAPAAVLFAQGRPEKMMTLADLPEPVETPHATGDLSDEEEQILALCMRGVRQFEEAWWVMGKAMANISSRRLYRKTHATFEDFARDTFNKSRPLAYEEMTSYKIGELLSARADKAFESESNDLSARADTPSIGKKAAGALNPITKDYGPEVSIAVHETIKDTAGNAVTVKALTGIVQQLPRRKEKALTQEELTALARELATGESRSDQPEDGDAALRSAVALRSRELADELKRGRMPRPELTRTLLEAFADEEDPRVYRALVRWIRDRDRAALPH